MKNRWLGFVALACVAALGVGAAFAGGAECHGKDATQAKSECNMSAEECAAHMQKDMATRGWLGIEKEKNAEGVATVTKVYPGSPAEQAGFQVGDRLVSVNGIELTAANKDKAYSAMKKAKIGDSLTYVVARGSENVTLKASLVKIPDDVLADSIQKHTAEHASLKK